MTSVWIVEYREESRNHWDRSAGCYDLKSQAIAKLKCLKKLWPDVFEYRVSEYVRKEEGK